MAPFPDSFHLQWHVTERCNLRCLHCYMDEELIRQELDLEALRGILSQYFALVRRWKLPRERNRISFTGGEPFVRTEIFDILEECFKNRGLSRYGVLTNGQFATDEHVQRLRSLGVDYAQVSIEGLEKTNDAIRGAGTFKKACAAARAYAAAGIETSISMTVTKKNVKDVAALIALARHLRAGGAGIRRLVPWGRGSALRKLMLSPQETKELFEYVVDIRRKTKDLQVGLGCEDGIACLNMHYVPAGCTCGQSSVTVLPNGTVYPCRRLPISAGDLRKQPLKDIFENSAALERLRSFGDINADCRACPFFHECRAGAACISYAYFGSPGAGDPQCWRRFERLSRPPAQRKALHKETAVPRS
ncbi:MAG: radical SAM protein [Candidatus Omnitrophica bacterium]|nr:radical SAM protein [Candidatus Omnitrophota bacterium]